MKNILVYLLFVFAIVALFGFAYSVAQEKPAGEKVFVDSKCGTCHSVESYGLTSKKKDAVDLSAVGNDKTAEFLSNFLIKKEKIGDKTHKTEFKGTEKDLKVLSEWLEGLKKEK